MRKVEVWADGACLGNPGPGGWGALIREDGQEKEIAGSDPATTNNRMELLGAISALEALEDPAEVVVTTDSQYVVKGMSSWIKGWRKKGWKNSTGQPVANRELWERLSKAAEPHKVSWKWVRGHSGHVENERVDALANAAARRAR